MNRTEKERRSKIKRELKQKEEQKILDALPISIDGLQKCFDFLDKKLSEKGCDNTFKFTFGFIEQNNLPKNDLIQWFSDNGGFCDCEILMNVEDKINDKLKAEARA